MDWFTWSNGRKNYSIDFIIITHKLIDYLNIAPVCNSFNDISDCLLFIFSFIFFIFNKKKKKKKKKHFLMVLLRRLLVRKLNGLVEFVRINMKKFSLIINS